MEDKKMVNMAKKMAGDMGDFVNSYSNDADIKMFIETMRSEHRTLQQNFTKLCKAWFLDLAERTSGQYDQRNEASVMLAKEIKDILENSYLPLV